MVGVGARSLRTQAGKRKATATPPPQKRAKKAEGKATGGIKINEPAPNLISTLTPPLGSWKKILIHRSNIQLRPTSIFE
jgi:hypothetical protein